MSFFFNRFYMQDQVNRIITELKQDSRFVDSAVRMNNFSEDGTGIQTMDPELRAILDEVIQAKAKEKAQYKQLFDLVIKELQESEIFNSAKARLDKFTIKEVATEANKEQLPMDAISQKIEEGKQSFKAASFTGTKNVSNLIKFFSANTEESNELDNVFEGFDTVEVAVENTEGNLMGEVAEVALAA